MNVSAQLQSAGGSGEATLIGPVPRQGKNAAAGSGGFTTLLAHALELPDAGTPPIVASPGAISSSIALNPEAEVDGESELPSQAQPQAQSDAAETKSLSPAPQPGPGTALVVSAAASPLQNLAEDPGAALLVLMPPSDTAAGASTDAASADSSSADVSLDNAAAELAPAGESDQAVKGGSKARSGRRQLLHIGQPQAKTISLAKSSSNQKGAANAASQAVDDPSDDELESLIQLNPAPAAKAESVIVTLGFFNAAPILTLPVNPEPKTGSDAAVQNEVVAGDIDQGINSEVSALPTAPVATPTPGSTRRSGEESKASFTVISRSELASRLAPDAAKPLPAGKPAEPTLAGAAMELKPSAEVTRPANIVDAPFEAKVVGGAGLEAITDDGTGSAQSTEQMKQRLKSDEIAASVGKNLPEVIAEPVVNKSRNMTRLPIRAAAAVAEDVTLTASSAARLRTISSSPTAAVESAPASPVARLFTGILEEATLVRRLRPDSLSVVIKPDSQTEIFVRLEMRDGRLEAAARCDRGDYQFLSAHWPELRQSLQHQGVRLQDLQQRPEGLSLNSGGLGNSSEQRRQPTAPDEALKAIAPAATRSKSTVLTARSAAKTLVGKRLLESWA